MDINRYTPSYNLKQRHLTRLADYSTEEIFELLYATRSMKAKFLSNETTNIMQGTTVALLFGDVSLRMRSAIEIGVRQLGGECLNLPYSKADMSAGENIRDIVNVISRYGVGALFTRNIPQRELEEFCSVSPIPIINSHNEDTVPLQAAADLFTLWEKAGRLENLKLAYVGKASSSAASLAMCAVKCGLNVAMAMPPQYTFSRNRTDEIRQYGDVLITDDPIEAVRSADVIYTDSYHYHHAVSGEERELLKPYQVNVRLVSAAKPGALIMHPLPATRGMEVTAEVIDGKNSIVYEQAENKLHAVKAVIAMLVR